MNEMLATPVRSIIECIESWHDDNGNWYRIFSDGFIEQGGFIPTQIRNDNYPVTLHKPFSNTMYTIITNKQIITNLSDKNALAAYSIYTKNKTITGFTTAVDQNVQCNWYACGY